MERNVKHLLLRKTNVLKARIHCEIFLSDYFILMDVLVQLKK